ncbi:hypothetical protein FGO68_gene7609 [Halteria grandinella]|uniref:Uncharacterized protein n=1 Tax=Halteria grandinella TaxID=5974 RepID=A0A8J8SXA8_HALGN|nr:hypothetical protein FGO68_gene7609 [Halteria grandinella]
MNDTLKQLSQGSYVMLQNHQPRHTLLNSKERSKSKETSFQILKSQLLSVINKVFYDVVGQNQIRIFRCASSCQDRARANKVIINYQYITCTIRQTVSKIALHSASQNK